MNDISTDVCSVSIFETSNPLRLAYAGFLARYSGCTLKTYRSHLDCWIYWCAQVGVDPMKVLRPHVEIWLRHLEKKHLASATRADRFGTVHLFYKYAVIDELCQKDPTEHVVRPKVHEGEQKRTWLPTL